jgi:hypothetical protein
MIFKRNKKIADLLDVTEQIEHACVADVDVKMKYAFVFYNLLPKLNVMCDKASLAFSWNDPDGTYDEDLDAFIKEIRRFKEDLEKLAL